MRKEKELKKNLSLKRRSTLIDWSKARERGVTIDAVSSKSITLIKGSQEGKAGGRLSRDGISMIAMKEELKEGRKETDEDVCSTTRPAKSA